MVNFTDLTLGMVMIHFFTFDPEWLPARRPARGRHLVLYDGVCGLCDRTVQFLLDEDSAGVLAFAPLQGTTAAGLSDALETPADVSTMLLIENFGSGDQRSSDRSTGVLRALDLVGGFWRVVSWARLVPRPVRDAAYRFVARHRYRWFGKFDACKLPDPATRGRFLD